MSRRIYDSYQGMATNGLDPEALEPHSTHTLSTGQHARIEVGGCSRKRAYALVQSTAALTEIEVDALLDLCADIEDNAENNANTEWTLDRL